MSKSKGNVINPLDKTSKFGTDALRLALTIGITPGNDGALGDNKIAGYRNFNNKLWNVARFTLNAVGDYPPTPPKPETLADKWILSRFSRENAAITVAIEEYRFSEAGERVYSLLWNDFADWYIEASKGNPNQSVLAYCLEAILKLAHPFAPYVTEAIWHKMAWHKQNLIISDWPRIDFAYKTEEHQFADIMALVSQIRSISTELKQSKLPLVLPPDSDLLPHQELIQRLARLSNITTGEGSGLRVPSSDYEAWLQVDEATVATYASALKRKRDEAGEYLARLERQLGNTGYIQSAPADLVEQTRHRAAETKLLLSTLDEQIRHL